MKQFILKCCYFLILLSLVFSGLNHLFDRGLRLSKDGELGVWNDIFQGRAKADILVMGNSRALVNVSPFILRERLGYSTYNLGMDGADFNLSKMRYQVACKRGKKPRILILVLGFEDVQQNIAVPFKEQLIPYLEDSIITKSIARYQFNYSPMDARVPLLKYRHHLESVWQSIAIQLGKAPQDIRLNGYQGRDYTWDETYASPGRTNNPNPKITPDLRQMLERFVEKSKSEGIELIMVIPPEYETVQHYFPHRKKIYCMYEGIARRNRIKYLNYADDNIKHKRDLFYTPTHLNKKGAEYFTNMLTADILKNP
jgi:hypothetical protein